ncbi:unnamed protein product [Owenia fusiformis]|uniref:Carbohydrate sulfotransferase n=1 Tax=Owenia fusiformis TaxID=6347 RepID=A0A8S4N2E7_OWEFU|nr:unnamed protein product [Owenia fusiformis]
MMRFLCRFSFSNCIWMILIGACMIMLIYLRMDIDIRTDIDERNGIGVKKGIDIRFRKDKEEMMALEVPKLQEYQHQIQTHINEIRKEHIEKVCKENPYLQHLKVDMKRNIAGLEIPFIWCRIPKTGTTTFYRILKTINMESEAKMINPYAIKGLDARVDQEKYFQELNTSLYKEIQNYTKILITRDPISRLISAYFDKFFSIKPQFWCLNRVKGFQMNRTQESPRYCPACNITFTDFLGFIANDTEDFDNIHWTPMYKLCNPCGLIQYDIISYLETYKQDVLYFLHEINAHIESPFKYMSDEETDLDIIAREVDILTLNANEAFETCGYTMKYLIARVFKGLVSKGVISQDALLPYLGEPDVYYTSENIKHLLTNVYLSYKGYKVTHKQLRKNMLKDIPDKILDRIFDIYKYDFEMFQFDTSIKK